MKNSYLLAALFITQLLGAAEYSSRPRKIRSTYETLEGAVTIRFAYDNGGNINSVSTFSALGELTESEFFIYSQGCVQKILKYRLGRLVGRTILKKDSRCRTIQMTEYDPKGNVILTRQNTYSNGQIISYIEYDNLNQKTAEGRYVYEDGHLIRIESSDKTANHKLIYKYTPGYISFYVVHEVAGHDGPKVSGKMIFTTEEGPITEESKRVFFE